MTEPLIMAPDVDLAILERLRAARTDPAVHIGWGVSPNPRHPKMVMVVVEYGDRVTVAQQDGVARINVWGPDFGEARSLAQWAAAVFWQIGDGSPIQRVNNQYGPSPVPDESGQTRLYMTFDIRFRLSPQEG